MPRLLPSLAAVAAFVLASSGASAQVVFNRPIAERAAHAAGRVDGIVTDQAGATLGGVSIVALGTALGMARTDSGGRFSLSLPPGQYVLRATREGYISTYREPVRIQSDVSLRRSITLVREDGYSADAQAAVKDDAESPAHAGDHAHTETAWRLRHLDRSVLRDAADETATRVSVSDFNRSVTPVDWLLASSTRAATAFFGDVDFNGQVNFLATSALASWSGGAPDQWGRGVAYVVVGAPVGSRGDWLVRAAVAPGESSSWNLQGEYQARENRDHVFRTGMSYSIQADSGHSAERASMAMADGSRRAGGVYAFDVWSIRPGLTLDYGASLQRYDYLEAPSLISGRVGVRADVTRRLALVADVAPGMAAPGAAEFDPPARSGAWLPPERTFSTLNGTFRPERIQRYGVGVETLLAPGTSVTFRRFSEVTEDQIATIFGLDGGADVGHYYVATAGTVALEGLSIGVDTRISELVRGRVIYTRTGASWTDVRGHRRLDRLAPSVVRSDVERGHDLTTVVDATVPATATQVSVAYRLNNLFSDRLATGPTGSTEGRFSFELRQQLPYRPMGQGQFNILISARTLLRDAIRDGAFYDELMTLAPPMQVACGIQMRF